MKDSSSLPVSVPTMRAICAAEDPEATIFKNPRGMSIDDWTINDVIASPNKSLKSPLTVETNEAGEVVHVMAGINEDMLGLFIPRDRRKNELQAFFNVLLSWTKKKINLKKKRSSYKTNSSFL